MNIIKEYLVKLGWDIDKRGMSDFFSVLERGSKTFAEFAGISSLELVPALKSVANDLEKLYYSSRRTGATAKNINILRYSAEQIGLSADDASSALEGMTRALRSNPGLTGLLSSLGVQTRGRDRVQVMMDLVTQLRKMPFYQGSRIGQMFGLDSNTLLMMEQGLPEMKKAMQERAAAIDKAGTNIDEQAKTSKEFNNQLREMGAHFQSLAYLFEKDFLPYGEKVTSWMKDFIDLAVKSDAATSGWSTRLGAVGLAFGGWAGLKWGTRALLGRGGSAAASSAATTAATAGGVSLLGTTAAILGTVIQKGHDENSRSDHPFVSDTDWARLKGSYEKRKRLGTSSSSNNPGNLRSFGSAPIVGGFAQFGSPSEGLSAMAQDLLTKYRVHKLNTVSGIVSRYAPPSENNTGSYISDVAKRMGVGANTSLNLDDPATLSSLMNAMSRHEGNPVSMDLINQAVATRLGNNGGPKVVVSQKTDIHVNGSSDPGATGRAVAGEQGRVNGDLVRNLQGAVR